MSYRLKQTLQYGVLPPQAFATAKAQLPTAFPLESALAAKVSQPQPLWGRVENRKVLQYNSKSAARRGGTFLFGSRMTPKSGRRFSEKVMRKRKTFDERARL
jgi:hypothetical protein